MNHRLTRISDLFETIVPILSQLLHLSRVRFRRRTHRCPLSDRLPPLPSKPATGPTKPATRSTTGATDKSAHIVQIMTVAVTAALKAAGIIDINLVDLQSDLSDDMTGDLRGYDDINIETDKLCTQDGCDKIVPDRS